MTDRISDDYWKDAPIRRKLLRRINRGDVCGQPTDTGRPCLGTPKGPGLPCWRHHCNEGNLQTPPVGLGIGPTIKHGAGANLQTLLYHSFAKHLPAADQQVLREIATQPVDTLHDLIVLARLRLHTIVKRYGAGYIDFDTFNAACERVGNDIRRLIESHQRIRLAEFDLLKHTVGQTPEYDAFDWREGPDQWEHADDAE